MMQRIGMKGPQWSPHLRGCHPVVSVFRASRVHALDRLPVTSPHFVKTDGTHTYGVLEWVAKKGDPPGCPIVPLVTAIGLRKHRADVREVFVISFIMLNELHELLPFD